MSHKKYEMNQVEHPTIPSQPGTSSKSPKVKFTSPYSYGDELIYTETPAKSGMFGNHVPAKTCRVIYIGTSYVEYGEDNIPQAIVKKDTLEQEQLRVDFSKLERAS